MNTKFFDKEEIAYHKIQELLKFADLIESMDLTSSVVKSNIREIKFLIENIHKSETHKNWNLCLDIVDEEFYNSTIQKVGFYRRQWSVYFECERLEIIAESKHTKGFFGHYGDDFNYESSIIFSEESNNQRIYMDTDIKEFILDAMNYKKYITKTLKQIEIDVSV